MYFGANDQSRKVVARTRASEFVERLGRFPFFVNVHAVFFDRVCRNHEVPTSGSASRCSHRGQRPGKKLIPAARLNVNPSRDDDHLRNEDSLRSNYCFVETSVPKTPIRIGVVGQPVRRRQTCTSTAAAMKTNQRKDQFAIDRPRKVQSMAAQSPEPRKIMGMARCSGKLSIIP